MTLGQRVAIYKDLAFTTGKTAALAGLTSIFGVVFAIPVIGTIARFGANLLVNKILGDAVNGMEQAAFFKFIDVRTANQGADFFSKATTWHAIKKDPNATKEQRDAAEKEFDIAIDTFIRLNT